MEVHPVVPANMPGAQFVPATNQRRARAGGATDMSIQNLANRLVIAGVLLIVKCTRGLGVVLSGAILFNIFFVNVLIMNLWNPIVIAMVLAGLYLAWVGRKGFCCLACCGSGECLGTCGCCNKEGSCGTGEKKSGGCCGN